MKSSYFSEHKTNSQRVAAAVLSAALMLLIKLCVLFQRNEHFIINNIQSQETEHMLEKSHSVYQLQRVTMINKRIQPEIAHQHKHLRQLLRIIRTN